MALVTKRISPHRRLGLSSTPTLQIRQLAGMSETKGAPVRIDSSGFIAIARTDSLTSKLAVQAAGSGEILGFLAEEGANDSSNTTKIAVVPALENMMFKGQMINTISGSLAITQTSDVGHHMGIGQLTDNINWGVDKGTSTSRDCVIVTELVDASGTCGGLVGFIVRSQWRQLNSNPAT